MAFNRVKITEKKPITKTLVSVENLVKSDFDIKVNCTLDEILLPEFLILQKTPFQFFKSIISLRVNVEMIENFVPRIPEISLSPSYVPIVINGFM